MADKSPEKPSFLTGVIQFYFAPDIRSVATLLYLGVFGYFTLYYTDSLFLALRYLLYVVMGHTALQGTPHLFVGMMFILGLVGPFFLSFYSIFVLPRVWKRHEWAPYVKWMVTGGIIVGGLLLITLSDEVARKAARQPEMQSFVEDAGVSGRI